MCYDITNGGDPDEGSEIPHTVSGSPFYPKESSSEVCSLLWPVLGALTCSSCSPSLFLLLHSYHTSDMVILTSSYVRRLPIILVLGQNFFRPSLFCKTSDAQSAVRSSLLNVFNHRWCLATEPDTKLGGQGGKFFLTSSSQLCSRY